MRPRRAGRLPLRLPNLCRIASPLEDPTHAASAGIRAQDCGSRDCCCALVVCCSCSLAAEAGLIRDLNSFGKEHKFKREA